MSQVRKNRKQRKSLCANPRIDKVYEASLVNPVFFAEELAKPANSKQVRFYMDPCLVFVNSACNTLMVRNLLEWYDRSSVVVVHDCEKVVGIVTKDCLDRKQKILTGRPVSDAAVPWHDVVTVGIDEPVDRVVTRIKNDLPAIVLHKNRPVGALWRSDLLSFGRTGRRSRFSVNSDNVYRQLFDNFPAGLVVLGQSMEVLYYNRQVMDMLPDKGNIRGKKYEWVFGGLFAANHREFLAGCPLGRVVETLQPVNDVEQQTVTGRTYVVNYYPVVQRKALRYIMVSFRDVTFMKLREDNTRAAYEELAVAFRLMLPNTDIEKRLKAIPEYQDYFDHNTGLVEITGVVRDGVYRHVLNCLKIASELHEKGAFRLPGIDRTTVVQALITHDLGKRQPRLRVGDMIDPRECFSDGKLHAAESAEFVRSLPLVLPDVVQLVRYHHHHESELPPDFPARLLPMLRLVRLIDGLSAGLTRKQAQLSLLVEGSRIIALEKNSHPRYNGIQEIDLLSGESVFHRF